MIFSDYLHLVNEREFKYLFERPLIWQSYAFWMILEIVVFIATVLTNVLYLMCRQISRNKLNVDLQVFEFYKWAVVDVVENIRKEKEHNTDYLRTGKEIMSLIFLVSFFSPLLAYLVLLRTKYFAALTSDQMNIFNIQTFFLLG